MNTVCRLCLKVDVKVYKLDKTHHKAFIENIFKLKEFPCVPSESHVCYICMALLSKTSNFIQMIWNAQSLIYDLLKTTGSITKPMLKHIDRQKHGLNLITLNSVAIADESEIVYDSYHKDSKLNMNNIIEKTQIKKEVDIVNIREALRQDKQEQEYKNTCDIQETGNISLMDCIEVYDSSDANIEEPIEFECYGREYKKESQDSLKRNVNYVEIDIDDPLAADIIKTENDYTLDVDVNAFDVPKSVSLKHFIKTEKPDHHYFTETESSSSSEEKKRSKNKEDEDYQPDSTSHSEDSNYDWFDDTGKRMKRPPDRVYPRKCDHCDYEVQLKCEHYRHYLFEHPNTQYPYAEEKIYACSICGKIMTKKRINNHERNHIIKEIKCIDCPKVFPNTKRMFQHRATVHPRQTYTCDYCSKTFKTRLVITRHIRVHTGEKPYKCHICGAGFAHSGNRTVHIRSAHQNYKYEPKERKATQKVRKNKKSSKGEKKMVKNHEMRQEGSHPETEIEPERKKLTVKRRKHLKNKHVDCTDTKNKSKNGKRDRKREKNTQKVHNSTDDKICIETDVNSEDERKKQKKRKNTSKLTDADTESDDENLAEKKRKKILKNLKSNKVNLITD